jgi:hypothetical protein
MEPRELYPCANCGGTYVTPYQADTCCDPDE